MKEKVEIELRDVFGKWYTILALPRKKIEEILMNLDIDEVVRTAYGAYCPGLARGVALLDVETGDVLSGAYTTGSGEIATHFIELYEVPANLDLDIGDILSREEIAICHEKYDGDFTLFCESEGIDAQEREVSALVEYAYDYIRSEDWWEHIQKQLDSIYEGDEEDEEDEL